MQSGQMQSAYATPLTTIFGYVALAIRRQIIYRSKWSRLFRFGWENVIAVISKALDSRHTFIAIQLSGETARTEKQCACARFRRSFYGNTRGGGGQKHNANRWKVTRIVERSPRLLRSPFNMWIECVIDAIVVSLGVPSRKRSARFIAAFEVTPICSA